MLGLVASKRGASQATYKGLIAYIDTIIKDKIFQVNLNTAIEYYLKAGEEDKAKEIIKTEAEAGSLRNSILLGKIINKKRIEELLKKVEEL
ncbi:MAG: hypothetical protein WA055_02440 [Candidatus Moraniibacteriota bacterium]